MKNTATETYSADCPEYNLVHADVGLGVYSKTIALLYKGANAGYFVFYMDPTCCGMLTVSLSRYTKSVHIKPLGTLQQALAKRLGYTYVTASAVRATPHDVVMAASYDKLAEFVNKRSNNTVIVYGKNVG